MGCRLFVVCWEESLKPPEASFNWSSLPETNSLQAPENGWLVQMYFLLKGCPFLGDMLVSGRVIDSEDLFYLM